ncbi:MAG: ferredoxin-thioredoxin reductase catalytic domain-containing protein [Candidatus Hodarchaeales archaeon]
MSDNKKTIDDVKKYVQKIAERNDWKLNPNEEMFNDLVEGLMTNFNRLGYYNCPCRDSQEDRKKDRDIICPCKYAKEDIKEFGHCYCALYFDKDFDFSQEITMIPERRPSQE